jgi:hypothetical protein
MMNSLDLTTGQLPPALRALAMGLVAEMAVPMLNESRPDSSVPAGRGGRSADAGAASWKALRWKCDELMALVLQADDPEEAAAYVLRYLPKHFEYVFKLLCGRKRRAYRKASAGTAVPTTPTSGCRPRS